MIKNINRSKKSRQFFFDKIHKLFYPAFLELQKIVLAFNMILTTNRKVLKSNIYDNNKLIKKYSVFSQKPKKCKIRF